MRAGMASTSMCSALRSMSVTSCSFSSSSRAIERPTAPAPAMATFMTAAPGSRRPSFLALLGVLGGGSAAIASASAAWPETAATYTWSPACTTVLASGRMPVPNRITNATRAPVASSRSVTRRPTHSSCSATSATATVPVGSRHLVVSASPTSAFSSRSVVHGTVATVGIPSRS